MYITLACKTKGTRLATPTLSLAVISLAIMVGVVRVSEYRNHWTDVLAGFVTGGAIATFLVRKHLSLLLQLLTTDQCIVRNVDKLCFFCSLSAGDVCD